MVRKQGRPQNFPDDKADSSTPSTPSTVKEKRRSPRKKTPRHGISKKFAWHRRVSLQPLPDDEDHQSLSRMTTLATTFHSDGTYKMPEKQALAAKQSLLAVASPHRRPTPRGGVQSSRQVPLRVVGRGAQSRRGESSRNGGKTPCASATARARSSRDVIEPHAVVATSSTEAPAPRKKPTLAAMHRAAREIQVGLRPFLFGDAAHAHPLPTCWQRVYRENRIGKRIARQRARQHALLILQRNARNMRFNKRSRRWHATVRQRRVWD